MKRTLLFFLSLLFIPASAFAAPKYERTIEVKGVSSPQPVFITVPEEITLYHSLSSLRILRDGAIVPLKTSSPQQGQFGGVISSTELCSIEGGGKAEALHDGNPATSVRPDPLKNPESCELKILFSSPVRVHGLSVDADQPFKKLIIRAVTPEGGYTQIGDAERRTSASFSSVVTTGLRITMEYEVVPALSELTLQGEIPARILFEADPDAAYVLVYGDDHPPALPPAPESLFAISTTPFISLNAERIREEDADGDGFPAARDNCPFVANKDQQDSDSDGVGDVCDNAPGVANAPQYDRDHDGVGVSQDNCPSLFNPDQRDEDLDGIGYVCDDKDGDGVMNSRDNCPGLSNNTQQDSDGNGVGDACELDRDSDGLPDTQDNCRGTANPEQEDRDTDGIGDVCDSCPDIRNSEQEDNNENGIGDACEEAIQDPDGDGLENDQDNCPSVANGDQNDADNDGKGDLCDNCPTLQNFDQQDRNKDGQGDVCTDEDGDGFLPHIDNCSGVPNADQSDKDNDGAGDACEDDDNDGIVNALDNCKLKSNRDQGDEDADGIGNACDDADDRFSEKYPWVMWGGMTFLVLILLSLVVRMILKIQKDHGAMPPS